MANKLALSATGKEARLVRAVVSALQSPESQRKYSVALRGFLAWYEAQGKPGLSRAVVQTYRAALSEQGMGKASINQRLSAIRKLAQEAAANGFIDATLAQGIRDIPNLKALGVRSGNWLSLQQAQALLRKPDISTLKGLRDRAVLAMFLGCGLRRKELADLTLEKIQQRDNRWVVVDMIGKGARVRTVPMPSWTKTAIDAWVSAAGIGKGLVFRSITKGGELGKAISPKGLRDVVAEYAEGIAPHDLRRTFAKLAHKGGAALEQISLSLGHSSVQTTERYLGVELDLANAPCDALRLKLA